MNKQILGLHILIIILGVQGVFSHLIDLPADIIMWWRCIFAFFIVSISVFLFSSVKLDSGIQRE